LISLKATVPGLNLIDFLFGSTVLPLLIKAFSAAS